jgi:YHS domain-containing protein
MGGLCVRLGGAAIGLALTCASASAQDTGQTADASAAPDMSAMAREGSGTSWLPDSSPMYMVHRQKGPWMLMVHENAFLQYLRESGDRGAHQTGSINWLMGMAERTVGRGHVALRGMVSLEPWTIRGCGYPDLLASGESCDAEKIHDRQHPHDLFMELSSKYDAPLAGTTRWQLFGGPAAEPALGPVAYPHRVSAMSNPIAPITHHWLDSTHVSFGVVTAGIYGRRWKVESSAFNGREPDEHRKNFDLSALDSVSGRIWLLPTPGVALQVSGGHLKDAEAGEGTEPRHDVQRLTASATFHKVTGSRVVAATFAWGRNSEHGLGTNALLLETALTFNDRHTWFGRLEIAQKTPHDLDVPETSDTFAVSKLQGGYTRYFTPATGWKVGFGGAATASIVQAKLSSSYGGRVNPGIAVFFTLRPAIMAVGSSPTMVMVQTAYDPTKLTCAAGFDPKTAAMATYEGKIYYFCSAHDRDTFLTDPRMSLSMMPPKQ